MFHMFVASTTVDATVTDVYREKQAFGPYTIGNQSGFSVGMVLEAASSAAPNYHQL